MPTPGPQTPGLQTPGLPTQRPQTQRLQTPGLQTLGRWALGVILLVAGVGHFIAADEFLGQVPSWMPAPEAVVAISGVIELMLGVALIAAPQRWRPWVGWVVAAFFVVIFPGNVWQFIDGRDAFGLESDAARFIRLLFQPVLVVWALWSTGAWRARGRHPDR